MRNSFLVVSLSEFSLDELQKQERSTKLGMQVFSGLLQITLVITIMYWAKQGFSFSTLSPYNPVLYCGYALLALGFLTLGTSLKKDQGRDTIKIVLSQVLRLA